MNIAADFQGGLLKMRMGLLTFIKKTPRILLVVCSILVPSLYFGIKEQPTEMGITVVAGCLTCVFLNLDKFIRFKGAGFEAELKQTVLEAQITISEMKKIIKPIALFSYHSLTHAGRWGSGREDQDMIATSLSDTINSLSMQDDYEIKQARIEYWRYCVWDKYRLFLDRLRSCDKSELTQEKQNVYNELESKCDYEKDDFPTIDDINGVFLKHNCIINPEDESSLHDYIEYLNSNLQYIK